MGSFITVLLLPPLSSYHIYLYYTTLRTIHPQSTPILITTMLPIGCSMCITQNAAVLFYPLSHPVYDMEGHFILCKVESVKVCFNIKYLFITQQHYLLVYYSSVPNAYLLSIVYHTMTTSFCILECLTVDNIYKPL